MGKLLSSLIIYSFIRFFLQYTKESLEIELRFLLFFFFSSSWSFIHDKLVFLFRQPLRRPPLLTSEVSHRYFCSFFFFLVRECAVKNHQRLRFHFTSCRL